MKREGLPKKKKNFYIKRFQLICYIFQTKIMEISFLEINILFYKK
jgi:hypothetical protein